METLGPPSRRVEIITGNPRAMHQVEAIVSLFTAGWFALMLIAGTGIVPFRLQGTLWFWPALAGWLALLSGEMFFFRWLKFSLDLDLHPFIPRLAIRQPRWPLIVRPFVLAFWLSHFVVSMVLLMLFEANLVAPGPQWVFVAALVVVVWIFTHCSQMFLFLAISTLRNDAELIDTLWRLRFLIELVLTGLAIVVLKSRP